LARWSGFFYPSGGFCATHFPLFQLSEYPAGGISYRQAGGQGQFVHANADRILIVPKKTPVRDILYIWGGREIVPETGGLLGDAEKLLGDLRKTLGTADALLKAEKRKADLEAEQIELRLRQHANEIGQKVLDILGEGVPEGANAKRVLQLLTLRSLLLNAKTVKEPGRGIKEVAEVLGEQVVPLKDVKVEI